METDGAKADGKISLLQAAGEAKMDGFCPSLGWEVGWGNISPIPQCRARAQLEWCLPHARGVFWGKSLKVLANNSVLKHKTG